MLLIQGYTFHNIGTITLKYDLRGEVLTYKPQSRYNNKRHLNLHQFGKGSFCKFKIDVKDNLCGVYALVISKKVKYIGECQNLRYRFNRGYGNISPRNCYKGGQQTNCRINKKIKKTIENGDQVSLYFLQIPRNRKIIERELIDKEHPCWSR